MELCTISLMCLHVPLIWLSCTAMDIVLSSAFQPHGGCDALATYGACLEPGTQAAKGTALVHSPNLAQIRFELQSLALHLPFTDEV